MPKTKKRKKPSNRSETPASRPRDAQGRRTTGSIATTRKVVAVVGNLVGALALAAAVGMVAWLLIYTAGGGVIGDVFEDTVMAIATPFLLTLLSLTGFIFGQFAVRGRWGLGGGALFEGGFTRVELRPISVLLHIVFAGLAVAAWVLVVVVPVVRDAQSQAESGWGASGGMYFWYTVTVYAVVTGAIAAMVAVSLLKKLTYNRSLSRNADSIIPGSHAQLWWRKFSHIWRAELGIAGFAGAAFGLSPLGVHLQSPLYGFGALGIGIALMAIAVALALNSWRSGLPVERVESYT
ncbi:MULTISPECIES: hypothetical protein [unclassified Microbacterium]|uniref:hypothetical protein n=1 Tax=unclassified Microbacterium TaxID=2609290 RepID=UPI00214D0A93|nr:MULTISPECIES: hypothetical protein [unclassified Microbacterium]MCR2801020.1 hypothetical protein [Microbacterium sp. zg.Y818]MCR2826794.1 hypothetical protein [Microbacterium sp. zg.Y909]WIM23726.1 hypothetical protein QNO21_06830 [Microbacterium sp. zg-Y818]